MNKLNRFLLRKILQSELKKRNQTEVVTDLYYTIASYMVKNYSDFENRRHFFYPHLSDTRRKSFEEFISLCHIDCVNRVKINGADKEI
jgi:hypothetical protein